eukprot:TRINITY_DN41386_c0_g1_i1.p1 TRINITY_DN41386_c0_g1~~TRINITY_DN41386_c0_g1_i1.p1  ORF type:complete len:201 (-),score=31.15 TRINITY_DN41386_c0_g1_i1:57-659(-)
MAGAPRSMSVGRSRGARAQSPSPLQQRQRQMQSQIRFGDPAASRRTPQRRETTYNNSYAPRRRPASAPRESKPRGPPLPIHCERHTWSQISLSRPGPGGADEERRQRQRPPVMRRRPDSAPPAGRPSTPSSPAAAVRQRHSDFSGDARAVYTQPERDARTRSTSVSHRDYCNRRAAASTWHAVVAAESVRWLRRQHGWVG